MMRRKYVSPDQEPLPMADPTDNQPNRLRQQLPKILIVAMLGIGTSAYIVHLHGQRIVLEKAAQQRDVATDQLLEERDHLQAETTRLQATLAALNARLNQREETVLDLDRRRQDLEEHHLTLLERQTKAKMDQAETAIDPNDHQSLKGSLATALKRIERERALRSEMAAALADHREVYRQQAKALAEAQRDKVRTDFTIGQLRKSLEAHKRDGEIKETHL